LGVTTERWWRPVACGAPRAPVTVVSGRGAGITGAFSAPLSNTPGVEVRAGPRPGLSRNESGVVKGARPQEAWRHRGAGSAGEARRQCSDRDLVGGRLSRVCSASAGRRVPHHPSGCLTPPYLQARPDCLIICDK